MTNKQKYLILFGALLGAMAGSYYTFLCYYGISKYNSKHDKEAIFKILNEDWYWLVSEDSVDFDPEFTFTHESVSKNYPDHSLSIFVYRYHGIPVAFTTYYKEQGCRGKIQFLAVSQQHRNKGLGKQLLDHIEQDAIKRGMCALELATRSNNIRAQTLYKKQGYRLIWDDGQGFVGFEKSLLK